MKRLILALVMWFVFAGAALAAVNINSATKEELMTLKNIGEKRAVAIIDYRKKNGDFKSIDELEKVEGIGPGTMKQIRAQVSTTGKTTIDKPEKATKTKAAEPAKGTEMKKAEPAKGDAMKAEKAKEKVAEKSKADDKTKGTAKTEEKKTEKK